MQASGFPFLDVLVVWASTPVASSGLLGLGSVVFCQLQLVMFFSTSGMIGLLFIAFAGVKGLPPRNVSIAPSSHVRLQVQDCESLTLLGLQLLPWPSPSVKYLLAPFFQHFKLCTRRLNACCFPFARFARTFVGFKTLLMSPSRNKSFLGYGMLCTSGWSSTGTMSGVQR